MNKSVIKKLTNIIYPIITLLLLVLVWFLVSKAVNIELIIPSVKQTFIKLGELMQSPKFYKAVLGTFNRTMLSFVIAFFSAFILAVICRFVPFIYKLMAPVVTVIRAVPTMSVILMTVIWLKSSQTPLLVAFLIIFPIMFSGFYISITSVDKSLVEMSKAYKVSFWDKIFRLYIPNIAPSFFDTIKNCISMNVKIIISAEVLAQTKASIGIAMYLSRAYLETAELLAWTVVAIIMSYLLELAVILIKKMVVRWDNVR